MSESRSVAFQTLGCKLNQYETDAIASQFLRAGYRVVPFEERADAYVINTCTVTNKADRKSRNVINRALRTSGAEGGNSVVVVTGCYAERGLVALEEGQGYVVGNRHKSDIFQIVDAHLQGEILTPKHLSGSKGDRFAFDPAAPIFHTRSMVKIQDGCDNFCSFCIIPYVRGGAESRPVEEVLSAVIENLRLGYREIVLTGVNMSRYQYETTRFSGLLERIFSLPQDFRLRISSLEPDSFDERFFRLLEEPRFCPHLHLCLQSGSERMLLAMRRQYTVRQYLEIVERIREGIPEFNLTTDIIVGFPNETDDDFAQTCAVIRRVRFSHIHTFRYSRRSGTRADRMGGHIAEGVKEERSRMIRAISREQKMRQRNSMIGIRQRLLVEKIEVEDDGMMIGRGYGEHYAPILYRAPDLKVNGLYEVGIVSTFVDGDGEPILIGTMAQ